MHRLLGLALSTLLFLSACSGSSPDFSSDKPNAILTAIASAVSKTGGSLATSRGFDLFRPTAASCTTHGAPSGLSEGDNLYPGTFTYCYLTVNDGDTVLGGFSTAKHVSCALEAAGALVFDGIEHTYTLSTSACFSDSRYDSVPATVTAKVTASAPFAGNPHFANGAVIQIDDIYLTLNLAANVSGTSVSFITHEYWTNEESKGATHGTFDTTSGDLWYEQRNDRLDCTTLTDGRCGWNRHARLHAKLTMSGTTPTGLVSLTFGHSNIQQPPGQTDYAGRLVSASGALSTGIKPRLWSASDGSGGPPHGISDYQTTDKWVETSNTSCFTSSSETASGCDAGLDRFRDNTKFAMENNEMQTDEWFAARPAAQSFTDVDINSDIQ